MVNLQEAFSKLNMMESSEFELLDQEEKDAMKNFLDEDDPEAEDTEIIDPQAEDESELEDSYIGKIIVQCPVCKSLIYKTQEELDEEGDEPQSCPYCFSVENFDIIGKIVPIEDEEAPEVVDDEAEEAAEESEDVSVSVTSKDDMSEGLRKRTAPRRNRLRGLKEDLENVTVETEKEIINISSQDKDEPSEDDFSMDFDVEEPEEEHETSEVIAPLDGPEEDEEAPAEDEIDEVDEESFDDMAESLLRENYKNIISYKTRKMIDKGNYIIAEGVIALKKDNKRITKLTEFRIRPSRFSRDGRGACLIENLQLGKKKVVPARVQMNEGIFGKKEKGMNTYQDSDEDMIKKGAKFKLVTSKGTKYYKDEKEARDDCNKLGGQLYGILNKGKFNKEIMYGGK